ncbi:hypothetical protein [Curtobacterium sp. 9128]|uniref:hypothetical protein n=1 Tax=Curtobacterium sp. 9128 TaxID=1793722 RepID=UPI0016431235
MRDDASWQRGHRAAFLPMCVAAAVALALGVVCIVVGRADDVGTTVLAAGVLVAGALWGAAAAGRAVRRGPDED